MRDFHDWLFEAVRGVNNGPCLPAPTAGDGDVENPVRAFVQKTHLGYSPNAAAAALLKGDWGEEWGNDESARVLAKRSGGRQTFGALRELVDRQLPEYLHEQAEHVVDELESVLLGGRS